MKQLVILVSFILIGCGSRKVAIQEVKKDSLSQIDTKIVTDEKRKENKAIETNINTISDAEETIFTPIDNNKEIIINGKSYFNVVLKVKKVKSNTLYNNKETIAKTALKSTKTDTKSKTLVKEKSKIKNIDKKESLYWLLWLLLIPIGYYVYKKYAFFNII
jgi:hypothetical protein